MSEDIKAEGKKTDPIEVGGPPTHVSESRHGAPGSVVGSAELNAAVLRESRRRTRRSFVIGAAAAAGGYGFYRWIDRSEGDELMQKPLREAMNNNAAIARAVFDERGLAPTYR